MNFHSPEYAALMEKAKSIPLASLPLSTRILNCLKMEPSLKTVADIMWAADYELMRIPNMGRVSITELRHTARAALGLEQGPDDIDRVMSVAADPEVWDPTAHAWNASTMTTRRNRATQVAKRIRLALAEAGYEVRKLGSPVEEPEVRITLRLPASVHAALVADTAETNRSLNGEIVARLKP